MCVEAGPLSQLPWQSKSNLSLQPRRIFCLSKINAATFARSV